MRAFRACSWGRASAWASNSSSFRVKGRGFKGWGRATGVCGGLERKAFKSARRRFLFLGPLEEAVQVIAQLHLGLEHVGLHALAHVVAGFGHLHHLLPELLVLLGQVEVGIGQGQAPIADDHLGPDFIGLVLIGDTRPSGPAPRPLRSGGGVCRERGIFWDNSTIFWVMGSWFRLQVSVGMSLMVKATSGSSRAPAGRMVSLEAR